MARSVTPPALSERNRSYAPAIVRYGHRRKSARSMSARSSSRGLSPEIPELKDMESDSTRENHSVRVLSSYEARGRSLVRTSAPARKAASTSRHTVVSDSEEADELALPAPPPRRPQPLRELNTAPSSESLSRATGARENASTSRRISQSPMPGQPSSSNVKAMPRRISQPVAAMKLAKTINVAYGHLPLKGHKPAVSGAARDSNAPANRPSMTASEAKSRTRPEPSTCQGGVDAIQSSPGVPLVRQASTWLNAPKPGLDETGRPLSREKRYFIGIPPPRFAPAAKKVKVMATPRPKKDAPISSYAARLLSFAPRMTASSSKTPVRPPAEEDAIATSSEDEVASLVPFPVVTPAKPVVKSAAARHLPKSAKKTRTIQDNEDIPTQELVSPRSAHPVSHKKNIAVANAPRGRLSGLQLSGGGLGISKGKGTETEKRKGKGKAPAILPFEEEEESSEDELLRAEVVRDLSPVPITQPRDASSSRSRRPQLGTPTPRKSRPSTATSEKNLSRRKSDAAHTTVLGKRKSLDDTPSPDPRPDVVLNTGWYLDADTMQWKRRPQNAVPTSIVESAKALAAEAVASVSKQAVADVVAPVSKKVAAEVVASTSRRVTAEVVASASKNTAVEVAVPAKPRVRKRSSLTTAPTKPAAAITPALPATHAARSAQLENRTRRITHPSIMNFASNKSQSTMLDVAHSTAKALQNNLAGPSRVTQTSKAATPHKPTAEVPQEASEPAAAPLPALRTPAQHSAAPVSTEVGKMESSKRPRGRPRKHSVVDPPPQPAEDGAPVVKRPRGRPRKVAPDAALAVTQPTLSHALPEASAGPSTGPSTPAAPSLKALLKQHQSVIDFRHPDFVASQHGPSDATSGGHHPRGAPQPQAAEDDAPLVKRSRGRPRKAAPEAVLGTAQPTYSHAEPQPSTSSSNGPSTPAPLFTNTPLKRRQNVIDFRYPDPAPTQYARAPPPDDLNAAVPEYQRREYFCSAFQDAWRSFASNGALRGMLFRGKFCELVDPTVPIEEFLRSVVTHMTKTAGLACGHNEIPTEPTYSAVHAHVLSLPCACSPSPYRQCNGVVRFTVDGVSGRIHGVRGLSVTLHVWH